MRNPILSQPRNTAVAASRSPAADGASYALGELLELVLARRVGVEYQPIIELSSGAVVGHEALSRFYDPLGQQLMPAAVFARLHEDPALLLHVEVETKRVQLAHAPPGALYLNVDPDSFAAAGSCRGNPLVELLGSRRGVVVEVIENMSISDAHLGRAMVRDLRRRGLGVALDDVGAPDALLSLEVLADVDVVKLDRSWFRRLSDENERAVLESVIALTRRLGARTVLEGAETPDDLVIARHLGVDCVQGYLFTDQFLSYCPATLRG
jgi:EAL domain-containing protein (putative c-di-GMP-specific phosphodiesterase class I)